MSLEGAIRVLQEHALSCKGVKHAPDYLPEAMSAFPFVVSYPERGRMMGESNGVAREIHTVVTEFHVAPRAMLGEGVEAAKPYLSEYFGKLVADPKLDNQVDTVLLDATQPVIYEFGVLSWANLETIGFRLHITIKLRS